jgi:O-antigen ligase
VLWLEPAGLTRSFESRGFGLGRARIWADAVRLVPDFPLLGVGFNAFGTAYPRYQTIWKSNWIGEAHNEYLQVLIDLGLLGAVLASALLLLLLRAALHVARRGQALDAGLLGSVLAACLHNLVEFNWQIPANAVCFAVLAGVTMHRSLCLSGASRAGHDLDPPAWAA